MLFHLLTTPLRAINEIAAWPFARVLNFYLPFHIGFVVAACWFVDLLAVSFEVLP